MKLVNVSKALRDFYSAQEDNCADCGTDIDSEGIAYCYMRQGEPIFKCEDCDNALELALLNELEGECAD